MYKLEYSCTCVLSIGVRARIQYLEPRGRDIFKHTYTSTSSTWVVLRVLLGVRQSILNSQNLSLISQKDKKQKGVKSGGKSEK
jgi:hypothetical protein